MEYESVSYIEINKLYDIDILLSKRLHFSGIYIIENMQNSKVYVGQSINVHNRLTGYKGGYGISKCLKRAILKHGWGILKVKIPHLFLKSEDLNKYEQFYIDFYKSYDSEKGYNIGRFVDNPCRGRKVTEEELIKMRNRRHSEETKKKIGLSSRNRVFPTKKNISIQ